MLKMSQGNSPKTSKKDKMISPGQKNSTKLLPEFIQAIDDLFVKLELTYHYQFYKVFGDDDKLLTGKKIWAKNLKKFNVNELMIIGSLLEKEGLDEEDKRKISSVIFNRLDKKMKLQIDATVLFAITNGQYDLNRKLLLSDLKINHPFNTYINKGLPPEPISYVGKNTLDILFENNKNDFLFYFFNYSLNKHIFSKSFKEHKKKLYEYRKK